ncbi:MAG: hypothetical protein LBR98_01165 [Syntrophomonadaceae bacterium]|jgi:ATP-dependent DNA helicase DinG|nr:hypothetical protein [Syntrophomonadaceae bacterium]
MDNEAKGTDFLKFMENDFDIEKIIGLFSEDGPIAGKKDSYKRRSEQIKLAENICGALYNQEYLLAEAGTGIGKTYAYLVPAVFWALYSEEKVVISTKTKALQKQITAVDIPELQKMLGWNFKWAQVTGRENYLCMHKYNLIKNGRKNLNKEQIKMIEAILNWAETTGTGDRQELHLPGQLMKEWGVVGAHRKNCLKDNCRFREQCFYVKMLKKMYDASVIVVNHALLMSDIAVDYALLPEYHYLIVDEAHNLEKEAFDKLCCRFSRYDTEETLKNLCGENAASAGLLKAIEGYYPSLKTEIADINNLSGAFREYNEKLFAELGSLVDFRGALNGVKILSPAQASEECGELTVTHQQWQDMINLIIEKTEKLCRKIEGDYEEGDLALIASVLREISDCAFKNIAEDNYNENYIQWLEYEYGKVTAYCSSPINIGGTLSERLYTNLDSLIMVSATLTVADEFGFMVRKLGLERFEKESRLRTVMEKSPFPYDENASLITLYDSYGANQPEFQKQLETVLMNIITVMGGRTLVLFTSRVHMLQTARQIKALVSEKDLRILVQNEDGAFAALIEQFSNSSNTVLFGLETFWEGIDLRGEILTCLIIVKLPFRSPGDPYANANDRYCRQRGIDGFRAFTLPDAALHFKQGAGRLIRSEEDKGILIVLDGRFDKSWYGAYFKKSIPIQRHIKIKSENLIDILNREIKEKFLNV